MGTKLDYLSKLVMLFLIYATTVFSQDITNTIAPSGKFIVKDASNNYLTLEQLTGQVNILKTLRLENTTSSTLGIIFKGTDRFIHNYSASGTGENTFVGINAGNFSMVGASYNTAVGNVSLTSLTSGNFNSALGSNSLYSNTTGLANSAFGYNTLYSNTEGLANSAFGYESLYYNTTGNFNSALGSNSLYSNTTGNNNSAFGPYTLYSNTTGTYNSGFGYNTLSSSTTGNYNTAMGNGSLGSNTTGDYNTALGSGTGSTITTGSNLTCIGYDAEPYYATSTDQITLGNGSVLALRCNVQYITSLSDARDKKNIKNLDLGIDFLMKIKPRQFNWDKREWYDDNTSDGSKMKEAPTAGFIAQELDEAQTTGNAEWLNLVLKDNPEKWEATPGNLLPIMVKAIQDLNLKCEDLKAENEKLNIQLAEVGEIKEQIAEIKTLKAELKEQIKILKASNNSEEIKFSSIINERIDK